MDVNPGNAEKLSETAACDFLDDLKENHPQLLNAM